MTSPAPRSRSQRARALAYLVAQHPLRLHRGLVRRGLLTGYVDELARYWDRPGVPLDSPMGFQALRYHHALRYLSRRTPEDYWTHPDAIAMLFSHVWRRELHPLRWLPWAWALRDCRTVLEYGAGSAPFAHGMTRAWPFALPLICVADQPGPLHTYCQWRFARVGAVRVVTLKGEGIIFNPLRHAEWDGLVCMETFEHLPAPLATAHAMMQAARVVVFDYCPDAGEPAGRAERADTLRAFATQGTLTGPTSRGTYVWRRVTQRP